MHATPAVFERLQSRGGRQFSAVGREAQAVAGHRIDESRGVAGEQETVDRRVADIDGDGWPDLFEAMDGNGAWFSWGSPTGLVVDRALSDDALRTEMSAAARAHAARYTWEATARGTLEVLAGAAIARRGRA